jgi:hypothetical protein
MISLFDADADGVLLPSDLELVLQAAGALGLITGLCRRPGVNVAVFLLHVAGLPEPRRRRPYVCTAGTRVSANSFLQHTGLHDPSELSDAPQYSDSASDSDAG